MGVLGLSLITNMASGILDQPITGVEVLGISRSAAASFELLVQEILTRWD
jgi:purine nucleoside phosphorylase